MTGINDPFRIQNIDRDNLYIEAFMPGNGTYLRVQIDLNRIAYRKEIAAKTSALVLAGGMEVPVALSLDALRDKINGHSFKEGQMIDLKPFTGEAVNISPDGSLKIKLYVHFKEAAENEFAIATIDDGHVDSYKSDNGKPYIKLKDAFKIASLIAPCLNGVYTTMPVDTLKSLIVEAKMKQFARLDLTEETKPINPDKIRPPITL